MSNGFLIFMTGIIMFVGTIIWIYIDNKNKDIRKEELVIKINEKSLNAKFDTKISEKYNTEKLEDSTEMLHDSTELLDETEII